MTTTHSVTNASQAQHAALIAQCVHGLGIGGAQQVIRYIIGCGDRARYRHVVYTPEDGVLRKDIEAAGAVVRIIPRHVPKFDPAWVLRLARTMRQDGVRLVHTHLFGDSLHGCFAARLAGVPVVMTLHSVAHNFSALQLRGYRWLIRNVDKAIACSPSSYATFSRATGYGDKLSTIANGLSAAAIPTPGIDDVRNARVGLAIPEGAMVVGAVGRLVEAKGYTHLIASVRKTQEIFGRDVRLVFVGEGPLRAELEGQAQREGVADRVIFAGFRSDTATLLNLFDVVVFSSLREGIPLALLEAMAIGKCVVSTAVPSLIDVLTEETASLVPAKDPDALGTAIARVLKDADLRRTLGSAARRRFFEGFTAEEMTEKYEAVYAELLAARPGSSRS
jgi:glycosyltransferase involved in cell wall biosynthesis